MEGAVHIVIETRLDPAFPLSKCELEDICLMLLDGLGLTGSELTLTLVDDKKIASINAEFLGCTGPTNILSFPAQEHTDVESSEDTEEDSDDVFLGDLALSVDTLARETDLYGQTPVEHLARLLAHGMLHLAGYDHGEEMFDLTDVAVDLVLLKWEATCA